MNQDTENIEAKLCSYIEGDLDAAGRAEIEAHLRANPQHEQLLREMAEARGMLRRLPREKAPAEVTDSLQMQLERSVLLGADAGGESAGSVRMNRWSQAMAMAAIVLLAVGLGVVVYFALPPSGSRPPVVATVMDKTAVDEEGAVAPTSAPVQSQPIAPAMRAEPFAMPEVSKLKQEATATGLRVVVWSNNPAAANQQVREFLTSNQITWSQESAGTDGAPSKERSQRDAGSQVENKVVVRGVNIQQVDELRRTLLKQDARQRVEVINAPTTQPAEPRVMGYAKASTGEKERDAATKPAGGAVMDVVIVVQNELPTSMPTSRSVEGGKE